MSATDDLRGLLTRAWMDWWDDDSEEACGSFAVEALADPDNRAALVAWLVEAGIAEQPCAAEWTDCRLHLDKHGEAAWMQSTHDDARPLYTLDGGR